LYITGRFGTEKVTISAPLFCANDKRASFAALETSG